MVYSCPVCGYSGLAAPPRSPVTGGASDEICPSCGFQFGFDDDGAHGEPERQSVYARWRSRWIQGGMKWFSRGIAPPNGWDPREQLRRAGR